MTSIQTDENDRRAPELCGLPVEEKFRQMLDRLESDPEYQNEYDTFAQGVSYAAEGEFPDFTTARQAVRDLVQVVSEHCLLNERTSPRA